MQETILHKHREAHVMARRDAKKKRAAARMSKPQWRSKQYKERLDMWVKQQNHEAALKRAVAEMNKVKKPSVLTRAKNVFMNVFRGSRGH